MKEKEQTRVVIIDDHPLVRDAMRQLIEEDSTISVVGAVERAADALACLERCEPDIVLLDLELRGDDGLVLLREIRARFASLPVLIVSMHSESIFAKTAFGHGANGYLMKSVVAEHIFEAIAQLLRGETYSSDEVTSGLLER